MSVLSGIEVNADAPQRYYALHGCLYSQDEVGARDLLNAMVVDFLIMLN